jgi:hypothetical protein
MILRFLKQISIAVAIVFAIVVLVGIGLLLWTGRNDSNLERELMALARSRSTPVIECLDAYYRANARLPMYLDELVPKCLSGTQFDDLTGGRPSVSYSHKNWAEHPEPGYYGLTVSSPPHRCSYSSTGRKWDCSSYY